jgi:hypothetical protein
MGGSVCRICCRDVVLYVGFAVWTVLHVGCAVGMALYVGCAVGIWYCM